MEIVRGRTCGYLTVPNDVVDGLLALGPGGIGSCDDYPWHVEARADGNNSERVPLGPQQPEGPTVGSEVPPWWC